MLNCGRCSVRSRKCVSESGNPAATQLSCVSELAAAVLQLISDIITQECQESQVAAP